MVENHRWVCPRREDALGVLPIPPSKARRATFWDSARKDHPAACMPTALTTVLGNLRFNYRQTYMNATPVLTPMISIFRGQVGLSIYENGLILLPSVGTDSGRLTGGRARNCAGHRSITSKTKPSGMPEVENIMKEDMISNALDWLSS